LHEGYVITPALSELLPSYEKQERAMRLYYPDLINAIDLKKEERRLAGVQFAAERARKTVRVVPAEKPVEVAGPYKVFEDAQALYKARKLSEARDAYMRVLNEGTDKVLHAKAYYGLARIAALERNPELSEQLFRKVLESGPDPDTKTWSLVYLGRLADSQGQREQATENYNAALKVDGATEEARHAAEKGLKESFNGK
jgi:tetratricopeptide (TPR) repeat protein